MKDILFEQLDLSRSVLPISIAQCYYSTMKGLRCPEFQEYGLLPALQGDINNFLALILRMNVFLGFFFLFGSNSTESVSRREVSDFTL